MRSLSSAFLLLIFIGIGVLPLSTKGQDTVNGYYIDISKINLSKYLKNEISSAFINKNESPGDKLSSLYFTPGVIWDAPISNNYVTKRLLLKFHLTNSSDTTASTWFFPGLFFKEIILYSIQGNDLTELPSISPEDKTISSYKEISLPAHESLTVLVELLPLKTYINSVRPRLIAPRFLSSYVAVQYNATADENMITYIFCGLLLLMIIYSMANFFLGSNPEFLYYSGYAFFLGLMLFLKTYLEVQTTSFSLFMESYLDFIMQGTGIIFYMVFMQKFLETKTKYRFLYHFYSGGIIMLAVSLALYSYSYFYTDNYPFQYNIETLTKLLLLLMVIVFLVYSFRRRQDRLLNYLFWGNLCMFVFSLFSQFAIFLRSEFSNIPGMLGSSIFYYEIGITLELILFLLGLSYKNRRQLIEETKEKERLIAANKLISYEKELAVLKAQQEERDRISADMHDELGSGITVIRLMSEIAKSKMPGQIPVEIEKISLAANEVLNKMNAIIWSLNNDNDSLDSLVYYIRAYSLEYFENTPVHCEVNVATEIPPQPVTGIKRRNTFLSVKEALNNILKHSNATKVKIDIALNKNLSLKIHDNGKGIDVNHLRKFGNGLKNMARRMESAGGTFKIENVGGTLITFELPL